MTTGYVSLRKGSGTAFSTTSGDLSSLVETSTASQVSHAPGSFTSTLISVEKSSDWARDKCFLDCALVVYISIKETLKMPENSKFFASTQRLLVKVFNKLFSFYRVSEQLL